MAGEDVRGRRRRRRRRLLGILRIIVALSPPTKPFIERGEPDFDVASIVVVAVAVAVAPVFGDDDDVVDVVEGFVVSPP
jgi:hypothetical protein